MNIRRLGYACTNYELNNQKPKVTTSRTMRKKTFEKYGMAKVYKKVDQNLADLLTILKWNEKHSIKLFRMSSNFLPWKSEWRWEKLPNFQKMQNHLKKAGSFAKANGHRLTFHPGHFNKLCSPNPDVVSNTIKELEMHSQILDIMGFKPSYKNSINIHIGAAYGNKTKTLDTFCKNFYRLSKNLKKRLTIENDDKKGLYNTTELIQVHGKIGIPIMFDFHHYSCNPEEDKSQKEAANMAIDTWPSSITPLFHWSEKAVGKRSNAHSDVCYGPLPDYTLKRDIDLMIEAKKTERSMFTLKNSNNNLIHTQ